MQLRMSRPVGRRPKSGFSDWPARLDIVVDGLTMRIAARRREVDGKPVLEYALPALAAARLR